MGNLGPARLNLMARDAFQTIYCGTRVLKIVIKNGVVYLSVKLMLKINLFSIIII